MKKPMTVMLISVGILFGCIFVYKVITGMMIKRAMMANKAPIVTISAAKAEYLLWEPNINATGSLRTVKGVDVTTELSGMIRDIYFTPGAHVEKNELLVQIDIEPDLAELKSLEAKAEYAKITYNRDKAQFAIGAVSKEQLDSDISNYKSSAALVDEQKANINKKTIRAPFAGKLGISAVNPGEYINAGQKVVPLQTLDPIYADFNVPQEMLSQLSTDQSVGITTDAYPGVVFSGKVTTINPEVDKTTRNIAIEATLPNPDEKLLPGMFANVRVTTGAPIRYLTLPQTAITFNSYGDIVYILKEAGKDKNKQVLWKAVETFVTTGKTRGDQIELVQGVKEGDLVVTSGQLKIKNGSLVTINNNTPPSNNPNPQPIDN